MASRSVGFNMLQSGRMEVSELYITTQQGGLHDIYAQVGREITA